MSFASYLSSLAAFLRPGQTIGMSLAWLVAAVALVLTLATWGQVHDSHEREAAQRFGIAAHETHAAIMARMATYEQVLRDGAALFAASVAVDRQEWRSYVEAAGIIERFPGIAGVGFAPVVSAGDRAAHVRAIRGQGLPDYDIRPGGARAEYTPIVYLEPFGDRNLRAIGYDMFSEPVRRAAMERARDSGEVTLSGKVLLVQDNGLDAQASCLLYIPVYRNAAPRTSVAERRAALAGYVYAAFRMDDLMRGILGKNAARLDLEIYDGAEASPAALLHDDALHGAAAPRFVRDLPIEVGGGTWTLRLSSTPEFEARIASTKPWWILLGGIVTTLLLFLLTATLARLQGRTSALAASDAEQHRLSERLDFLLRTTPAVIYAAKAHGDYGATFISANVREQLGHAPKDFLADSGFWANNIHPEDRERVLAHQALLFTEGRITGEYRFRHRDGSWRWMHDETQLVRDAAGEPKEMIGFWLDITVRKQAEDALRESESRFRALVESAPQTIILCDAAGRITFANARTEATLGYRPEELTGRNIDLLVPERLRAGHAGLRAGYLAAPAMRAMGTGRDLSARRQDGSEVPVEIGLSPVQIGGALHVLAVVTDISESRRVREAAEHLGRMKSEFMASVTHELRTPLNSVIGFSEMLHDGVAGPLNARQTEFVADILASGERLLALVEGILEMSQLDAADAALAREPVDVAAALAERVAAQGPAAAARGVTVTLEVAPDAGSAQLAPRALNRMVDALIDNAIKFNREGGSVRVRARRGDGRLEIAVTDTGIGIAGADLAKLFQPLVQFSGGLARAHGGIGLGLTLARRLAELHGGTIEVDSEPGKGSTFTIFLPLGGTS